MYENGKGPFSFSIKENGINDIIEEMTPTSYMALREVRWTEDGDYHLDLRRYFVKQDGSEIPGKGTIIRKPNKLTECLIGHGFGDTRECMKELYKRDDFLSALGQTLSGITDKEYKQFKSNLDGERKGYITADDFLEAI